jgi:hypothetical protein
LATLGWDDIETAAKTAITAAVTIMRMCCIAHSFHESHRGTGKLDVTEAMRRLRPSL